MKRKRRIKIILSLIITICVVAIIHPIAASAALQQSTDVQNLITVETIDSSWAKMNGELLTSLAMPEYVAPGEEVDISEGLYLKNIGVNAYARIKIDSEINNQKAEAFDIVLNANWIKGSDDFYYYCNPQTNGVLYSNEVNLVIEELKIASHFKNTDSGVTLKLILTAEVIDACSNEYEVGWGTNPPDQWFDIIG